MSNDTQITPTGKRGAPAKPIPQTIAGDRDRDEHISVLDPTPPPITQGIDPTLAGISARRPITSSEVVGRAGGRSALTAEQLEDAKALAEKLGVPVEQVLRLVPAAAAPPAPPVEVKYYRYVGGADRKFTMPGGAGRDGYTATIRPGKVLNDKDYPLASLKAQGFLPGRNLEPIDPDEARAS